MKFLFLISIVSFFSVKGFSQTIEGTYSFHSIPDRYRIVINFKARNFEWNEKNGIKEREGFGTYSISKDSLIFNFKYSKYHNTSAFEVVKSEVAKNNFGILRLFVLDDFKVPFENATITISEKTGTPLLTSYTDSSGQAIFGIHKKAKSHLLIVNPVGYAPVVLPLKKFLNSNSELILNLKTAIETSSTPNSESVAIKSMTANSLEILKGNELIRLKKGNQ